MRRRSIVREPLFEDSLATLFFGFVEEADEYTAAAEVLSRVPQIGSPLDGGVWTLPMAPIREKSVYLFYTFDESAVLLIALAAFDD